MPQVWQEEIFKRPKYQPTGEIKTVAYFYYIFISKKIMSISLGSLMLQKMQQLLRINISSEYYKGLPL